jgi:hypothetical protein
MDIEKQRAYFDKLSMQKVMAGRQKYKRTKTG